MNKHDGGKREFTQMSRSWYKDAARNPKYLDELTIGIYHDCGGTTGEFAIVWVKVGSEWAPQLRMFEDAWSVIPLFQDLLDVLAQLDGTNPSADTICEKMRELGIADGTTTESPYADHTA